GPPAWNPPSHWGCFGPDGRTYVGRQYAPGAPRAPGLWTFGGEKVRDLAFLGTALASWVFAAGGQGLTPRVGGGGGGGRRAARGPGGGGGAPATTPGPSAWRARRRRRWWPRRRGGRCGCGTRSAVSACTSSRPSGATPAGCRSRRTAGSWPRGRA